jgi:uncharacterized coiled-coil DUF342 family protein
MMLERDKHSNAIINSDVNALNKYKQDRALHRKVDALSKEVAEIKQTLTRVCETLDKTENW